MSLQTDLQAAVDKATTDSTLLHDIVHGDAQSTVTTEGGPVKSVAKALADIDATLVASMAELDQKVIDAATSETNAAASETAASVSASNAATSETNAATSAVQADDARSYAAEWANRDEDSLVPAAAGGDLVDDYSAKHFANKSSASAAAAGVSAGDAATSETNADLARQYASEWANKAEDSLISSAAGGDAVDDYSALHFANKAAASASGAAASEANAAASAANAATSALDADADATAVAADRAYIEANYGLITVSSSQPSGGSDGDTWYVK